MVIMAVQSLQKHSSGDCPVDVLSNCHRREISFRRAIPL